MTKQRTPFGLRLLAVAAVVAMILTAMPARTFAAQERGGGSYTSPTYDFTIEWDDTIWEGVETTDTEGVEFNSDLTYGFAQAIDGYSEGAEACAQLSADNLANKENIDNFVVAPERMERPISTDDAVGELYTYTNTDGGAKIVAWIECRDLADENAVLQVILLGFRENYSDAVPSWEELLNSIDTGLNASDKDDKGSDGKIGKGESKGNKGAKQTSGIDGNTYVDAELGYSSTWDDEIWNSRELDAEEGLGVGIELSTEYSFAWITGEELDSDFEDCATSFAERVGQWESLTKFRVASKKFERPETDADAVGELYTYTDVTNPDDPVKVASYFECRLLPDGKHVVMTIMGADQQVFEDELPLWEGVLAGIQIGDADTTGDDDSDDSNTDEDDTDDSGDAIEVEGVTFVGPYFGFELTFDDSVWTGEDLSDGGNDFLDLSSELAIGTVIGFGQPYDGATCVETMLSLKTGEGVTGLDVADAAYERPRSARGVDAELFTYTFEGQNGPVDVLTYIECRELAGGEATLGIALTTVPAVYADALPQFETLLAGVNTES